MLHVCLFARGEISTPIAVHFSIKFIFTWLWIISMQMELIFKDLVSNIVEIITYLEKLLL